MNEFAFVNVTLFIDISNITRWLIIELGVLANQCVFFVAIFGFNVFSGHGSGMDVVGYFVDIEEVRELIDVFNIHFSMNLP